MKGNFKKISDFKAGLGSIKVELVEMGNELVVLKHFKTQSKLNRELQLYNLLRHESFIPKIICQFENVIGFAYCGESLNLKLKPKHRYPHKFEIRQICKYLEDSYGIYHNDIRWKNVCMLDHQLFLIDWERWSYDNVERDAEHILNDRITPIHHSFW